MKLQVESNAVNVMVRPTRIPARIIFPEGEDTHAKKVVRKPNHSHVFKFHSGKCQRVIDLNSRLEYARARMLEMDPDVISFEVKPFQIEYADEGIVKSMFPDLLVHRRDGSKTIEEVMTAKKAAFPLFKRLVAIERVILAKHGYQFQVVTEEDLRDPLGYARSKS